MSEKVNKILVLFEQIEQGSKAAFDELFMLYHNKLLSLARQYVKNHETAEEITSELFVKLWLKRGKLSTVLNPEVYLFTCIKNASLNVIRSEKQRQLVFSSASASSKSHEQVISEQSSDIVNQELYRLLDDAVAKLPEQRRIIFILIKEEGLKSKAVAEILGLSIRTVENQLYKAVKSLADTLSGYLGYHPQAKKSAGSSTNSILSFFL